MDLIGLSRLCLDPFVWNMDAVALFQNRPLAPAFMEIRVLRQPPERFGGEAFLERDAVDRPPVGDRNRFSHR